MRLNLVCYVLAYSIATIVLAQQSKIESILIVLESVNSNEEYFLNLKKHLSESLKNDHSIAPEFYLVESSKLRLDTTIENINKKRQAFIDALQKHTKKVDKEISLAISRSSPRYLMRVRQLRQTNYTGGIVNGKAGEFKVDLFETASGDRVWTYRYDHHATKLKNKAKSSSELILKRLKKDSYL